MDIFNNPKIYKKESVEIDGMLMNGLYFSDDKGRDWYETLREWRGALAVDADHIVCAYEADSSLMGMEEGRTVYEVEPGVVPKAVTGNFTYRDGVFTDIRPDAAALAERDKAELLLVANTFILPLQDATDLDIATTKESNLLLAWKQYRVMLNRVDTSLAPDINWPVPPDM